MNNKPFYKIGKDDILTTETLAEFIQDFLFTKQPYLNKMQRYFLGDTDINRRTMSDIYKPNNKIVNPYANNITSTFTGYFMGEPVSYKFNKVDERESELVQFTLDDNDEDETNTSLSQDASVFGYGLELTYINEEAKIRFNRLNPQWCLIITDDTIEENVKYVVRLTERLEAGQVSVGNYALEVYDKDSVTSGSFLNGVVSYNESYEHSFGQIPITVYPNNKDLQGDFEQIISLIDAYDKLMSDNINDYEAFVDAYLVLENMTLDTEEAAKMRVNRTLILPDGGKASWLTKDATTQTGEELKDRIDKSIYRFAQCPNMSDENFAGNASGIAIQYKLMGMENICSKKERYFRAGLYNRLVLINHIMGLFGGGLDVNEVDIVFKRNIPANLNETAQIITMLNSIVSKETLLGLLPFVEDAKAEAERKRVQDSAYSQLFNTSAFATGESDTEQQI